MGHSKFFTFMLIVVTLLVFGFQNASAQTSTTGELTGVVTDPTKAVVPGAKVQLKDLQHGNIRETQTSDAGAYRFSLLSAGQYEVDVQASGFQPAAGSTTVSIGQVTTLDLKLSLQSMSDKVVVVEEVPMIQTENGNVTSNLSERLIQTMPNQGNDMTYPLEMTAGVIENTLGGYGNYSVNGISATGNLFTINGMDDNDPYLSLNNTGATSLMLGQGEVQEATIVSNGYGGQFGGLAGPTLTSSPNRGRINSTARRPIIGMDALSMPTVFSIMQMALRNLLLMRISIPAKLAARLLKIKYFATSIRRACASSSQHRPPQCLCPLQLLKLPLSPTCRPASPIPSLSTIRFLAFMTPPGAPIMPYRGALTPRTPQDAELSPCWEQVSIVFTTTHPMQRFLPMSRFIPGASTTTLIQRIIFLGGSRWIKAIRARRAIP